MALPRTILPAQSQPRKVKPAAVIEEEKPRKKPKVQVELDVADDEEEDLREIERRRRERKAAKQVPATQPRLPSPRTIEDKDPDGDDADDDDGRAVVRVLPGVKKTQLRRLQSMFGQRSDDIIDLLDIDESDTALALLSKTLLQTVVDVLPVVERNVRRSRGARGVVPLNQVITQIRELCHDIQAHKDRGMMGQQIVDRYLRPSYLDLSGQISAAFVEIENGARNRMTKEEFEVYRSDYLMLMKMNLATFLKAQYEDLQSQFSKALG